MPAPRGRTKARGKATPNARAVSRANANASFKRAPAEGFDLGKFLGQVGDNVRAAGKAVFPQGQSGGAISRAMKTGQDDDNPLKRILRGGK